MNGPADLPSAPKVSLSDAEGLGLIAAALERHRRDGEDRVFLQRLPVRVLDALIDNPHGKEAASAAPEGAER